MSEYILNIGMDWSAEIILYAWTVLMILSIVRSLYRKSCIIALQYFGQQTSTIIIQHWYFPIYGYYCWLMKETLYNITTHTVALVMYRQQYNNPIHKLMDESLGRRVACSIQLLYLFKIQVKNNIHYLKSAMTAKWTNHSTVSPIKAAIYCVCIATMHNKNGSMYSYQYVDP